MSTTGYIQTSADYAYSSTTSSTVSNTIWINWNAVTTTGTININPQGDAIFNGWTFKADTNAAYTTSTTYTDDTTWYIWAEGDGRNVQEIKYARTPEEIEAVSRRLDEEHREQVERTRKLKEKREAAETKAKELLLDLIGEAELKIYEETGRLFVKGRKYDYIVQKSGYVKRVEKDKITDLCVHLVNKTKYPETDNVIALKMAIEADEKKVLEIANKHGSNNREAELPRAACM